ncbi:MAG: hypothetical protein GC159_00610 [Phycisphaera sp.]|nr:hypothetical protein [Phycisphaera sp.]
MIRRPRHVVTWAVGTAAALLAAAPGPARAQSPRHEGFAPVEQGIADVDPLRDSLRQLAPGIGPVGQESWIYQRVDPSGRAVRPDRLYLIAPGVVAEYDRSQYIRITDDDRTYILQKIPPNTVFHIGLPTAPPPGQLNGSIVGSTTPRRQIAAPPPIVTRTDWTAWAQHRREIQRTLINAIHRVSDTAPK